MILQFNLRTIKLSFTDSLEGFKIAIKERNIFVLSLSQILSSFTSRFFNWGLPIIIAGLGGIPLLGFVYTIERVLSAPLSFIGGSLADVFGRKKVIILGSCLLSLSLILLSMAPYSAICLMVAVLIYRSMPKMYSTAQRAMIAESISKEVWGKAYSTYSMLGSFAGIIGSASLGIVTSFLGLRTCLTICALFSISTTVARCFLQETSKSSTFAPTDVLSSLKESVLSIPSLRERGLALYAAFGAVMTLGSAIGGTYFSVYVKDVVGFDFAALGILFALSSTIAIFTKPVAGAITDSYGAGPGLFFPTILEATLIMFLAFTNVPLLVAVILILMPFCEYFGQIADQIYGLKVTGTERRGTILGALDAISILSSFPGPLIGAVLWSSSPSLTIISTAVLSIFGGMIGFTLWKGKYENKSCV